MRTAQTTGKFAVALGLTAFVIGMTTTSVSMASASETSTTNVTAKSAKAQMSESQIRSEHQQALAQALRGDVKGGLRALRVLAKNLASGNQASPEADRVQMSIGRLAYETSDYAGSVAAYGKVNKNGASWLESLEEASWADFRNGETQESLAKLKTVTSPAFKGQVRSEPFFLQGLAQLRVCDFKAVFKTLDLFKERFSTDVKTLEASPLSSDKAKLKEIGNSIQKLNLVEAETIQRLYLDENGKKRSGSPAKITKSSDQLSFPTQDDDELWMDEIEGFRVTTKGCLEIDNDLGVAKSVARDTTRGESK